MSSLEEIIVIETTSLIKELCMKIDDGSPFGSFSTSLYDTAWLARLRTPDSAWLFPQCFQLLLLAQEPGGGWPVYGAEMDGLLSTMAALIALRDHQDDPLEDDVVNKALSSHKPIRKRTLEAEQCLRQRLQSWDVTGTVHVGFEMLVPALLEILEKDPKTEQFEFPGRSVLMSMNQQKLAKLRPEILYGPQTTTLVHSLEALVGKIDFDRVAHHLNEHGSMMGSPAATAAYLMNSSTWDPKAEAYLRNVVAHGSGLGSGGVPGAFPSAFFEVAWITSTLLKSHLSSEVILNSPEAGKIGGFLQSQFECHGGIVGFDSGLLADVDDTAKTIISLRVLGFSVSLKGMIDEFEGQHNFRTYQYEQNRSFSANCNVLDALLHYQDPQDYRYQIVKVSRSLCHDLFSGKFRDKWKLSDGYSFMLLSQALVKLLRMWDSDHLGQLPDGLVSEHIPIAILQTLLQVLHTQSADGFWTFGINRTESREITAYAILTLKSLSSIPWLCHFLPQVEVAIERGSGYLLRNRDKWHVGEHLWVAKVSYALPPVARAYIIAALGTESGQSNMWGDKVRNLITMPEESVRRKIAGFFSSLPMFSQDAMWILEGDMLLGHLYQSRLSRAMRTELTVQDKVSGKAGNKNNFPLPPSVLWEMMVTSVLIYKLDEFIETACGNEVMDYQSRQQLRSTVRALCSFPNEDFHLNGQPNSDSETPNTNFLRRYTSHVLKHPAVLRSPSHVRRKLHNDLAICLLAHIDSEEDNIFLTRQRQTQLPSAMAASQFIHPSGGSYYSWVQTTSANSTQSPSTFTFFTCLAAAVGSANTGSSSGSTPKRELGGGEYFFNGARQEYLSNALSQHLAVLCRQYDDLGSAARDKAEGNLNSLDFAEFSSQRSSGRHDAGSNGDGLACSSSAKSDLLYLAEYERDCMNVALEKLHSEMCKDHHNRGRWKMSALRVFIDTVILYGELYLARDLSNGRGAI